MREKRAGMVGVARGPALPRELLLRIAQLRIKPDSWLRQGLAYYGMIPMMKQESLEKLVAKFGELVVGESIFVYAFALK